MRTGVPTGGNPCSFCTGTMTLLVEWTLDDDLGTKLTDTLGPQAVTCKN